MREGGNAPAFCTEVRASTWSLGALFIYSWIYIATSHPYWYRIYLESLKVRLSLRISRLFLPPVWCDSSMRMYEKKSKSQLRYKKSLYICSAKNLNVFGWNDVGSVPTSVTDRLFWGYNAAQRCILFFVFMVKREGGRRIGACRTPGTDINKMAEHLATFRLLNFFL